MRGFIKKESLNDLEGACTDFKKSASLGNEYQINWLGKWCRNIPD